MESSLFRRRIDLVASPVLHDWECQIPYLHVAETFRGHAGCINCLDWANDGGFLFSGCDDKCIGIWEPSSGSLRQKIRTCHEHNIFSTAVLPSIPDTVVSCAADGRVALTCLTADYSRPIYPTDRMKRLAYQVSVCHEHEHTVLVSFQEGELVLIDTRMPSCSEKDVTVVVSSERDITGFALAPFLPVVYAGCNDGKVYVADLRRPGKGGALDFAELNSRGISGVDSSCDGRRIAVSLMCGPMIIHESPKLGDFSRFVEGQICSDHANEETFLKQPVFFGPNSEFVAHGGDTGFAHIYNSQNGKLLKKLKVDGVVCNVVMPHPNLPVIACSGIENTIKLLRVNPNQRVPFVAEQPFPEAEVKKTIGALRNPLTGVPLKKEEEETEVQALTERKNCGNALLAQRRYRRAFLEYMHPIMALGHRTAKLPSSSIQLLKSLMLNAALAGMKLGKVDRIVGDLCSMVLAIDPENPRALYRRALANYHLGEVESASEDVKRAMKLTNGTDTAIVALQQVIAAVESRNRARKKKMGSALFA